MDNFMVGDFKKCTKRELADAFPSAKLDRSRTKAALAAALVLHKAPMDEIVSFEKLLASKEAPEAPEDSIYIVIHKIRENGKTYLKASEYTGEYTERFLKGGQIRKKE